MKINAIFKCFSLVYGGKIIMKISISILELQKRYGHKEALKIAKNSGADAVDFGLEDFNGLFDFRNETSIYSKSKDEIRKYFEDIKSYADELGLEICQTHGRGKGFINVPEEDNALIKNAELDCLATSALGAPVCVMHGVTTMFHMTANAEFMHELNHSMFTKILPFAKKYGIKIATETFGDVHGGACCDFFGNIDEFIKTYEKICAEDDNREYFTICVDTGHSNKATKFNNNPQVPELIRRLGKNISTLHLNDNNTIFDQHLLPFENREGLDKTIVWDETIKALKDIGYNGVYNMEIFLPRYGLEVMPEFCRFAVVVLRNLLSKNGL